MAGENDEKPDFFNMSDEDILNINPASLEEDAPASSTVADEPVVEQKVDDEPVVIDPPGSDTDGLDPAAKKADEEAGEGEDNPLDKPDGEEKLPVEKPKADAEKPGKVDPAKPVEDQAKPEAPATQEKPAAVARVTKTLTTPEEFEGFYKEIMKPFKANGRQITLNSPDEAIRLMQMGAGYGRKLQDMQPHLKTLRMLEKNDLLDDTKLGFLIDLDKKNPDAIKKLLKDSGIDPLDINLEDNTDYKPTNHSVSDTEVTFADAVKEVRVLPGGPETIQLVQTWDAKSKQFMWDQPGILALIQEQRSTGIFDVVMTEVERLKLLGNIPPNTPVLEAYKIAGDALAASNSLPATEAAPANTQPKTPVPPVQPNPGQSDSRILATRAAAPKTVAANNEKAKAAASPQAGGKKAKAVVNPLDMADDDFLKLMPL